MSPEVTQLVYLGLSALIGWWIRHKGIIGGDPAPVSTNHPIIDAIRNAVVPAVEKAIIDAVSGLKVGGK